MGYKRGLDRSQQVLFPEAMDDYIAADNPVRFIDAFVESLDMAAQKFTRATPGRMGAPAYDPRMLLKLYIYAYLYRIRSSRRIEAETKRNVEVMWLTGRLSPDFKTIADFRRDHADQMRKVCKEFTVLCKRLDLFGRELVAIDGSKFRAVNAGERNYTQKQVTDLLKKVDERIAAYLQAVDEADEEEAETTQVSAQGLEEKIKALEEQKSRYADLLEQMQKERETQISLTDPESRRMKVQGRLDVCYNAQIAVDAKHHLIVAHEVTNAENDQEQLIGMALAAKEELEVETLVVVADGGYHTETQAAQCEQAGIVAHMPRPKGKGPLFTKAAFTYLPEEDAYRCPGGALLTYRHTEKKEGKEHRCYQTYACSGCPMRERCTKDDDGRRIRRSELEWAVERVEERVRADPAILRKRKGLAEHPFGTMKHCKGEGHFLLRGLTKVRGEFSLSVLAYNLRRVLNLLPIARLMALLSEMKPTQEPCFGSAGDSARRYGGFCTP